ncbi:hypothetical protein QFW96_05520 [Saccharopolyspora sp. TS4A08]|uniref:Uncharacterized protein n=1 Tax=Saccharopolyspora ipomoeae TaxID=3042027 RepID=A0ABT6PJ98_9PSEU|nr:hypothetical protein [Saccharopolyspora sp. TS4A08]MDI2028056.1 hypothetical protein [Saccharopolyspora sp. TS4A08]
MWEPTSARQEPTIDTTCLTRENVEHRVEWTPGGMRALCRCGAEREFTSAAPMWDWLLAHPHLRDQGTIEST